MNWMTRLALLSVLAFALTLVFVPNSEATSEAVVWQPSSIDVRTLRGTTQLFSVNLTASTAISEASLFVVPELAGILNLSLLGKTALAGGTVLTIPMEVSVPGTTPPGIYEGTVHVRSGKRTVTSTLKVRIEVIAGSDNEVVDKITDPSPDRVARTASGQFLVKDELIVVLKRDVADPNARIREVASQVGALIIGSVPGFPVYQLRVIDADTSTLLPYLNTVGALAGVEAVSLSLLAAGLRIPNEERFANLWNPAVASGENRHLEFIRAMEAWDITTGDKDVRAAVIDDGFEVDHEDLIGNVIPTPQTLLGELLFTEHGTSVAGTLCAQGDNKIGVVGVAWRCGLLLYSVRSAHYDGATGTATTFLKCRFSSGKQCGLLVNIPRALSAMYRAVDDGARVVNMSIGFIEPNCVPGICSDPPRLDLAKRVDDILVKGIEYSVDQKKEVLWVFAAGNEGRFAIAQSPAGLKHYYPQFADRIIVVAAAAVDDTPNNRDPDGPVSKWGDFQTGSNYGELVIDVAAPAYVTTTAAGNGYDNNFQGTSAAAPQVAGVAVLVVSAHPSKKAEEVKRCIVQSTTAQVREHAFKVINAKGAVECAAETVPPTSIPITIEAIGTITEVTQVGGSLTKYFPTVPSVGDPYSFRYTYDTVGGIDLDPHPWVGQYFNVVRSIEIRVGNNPVLSLSPPSGTQAFPRGFIQVGGIGVADTYGIGYQSSTSTPFFSTAVSLGTLRADYFEGDALPTAAPPLPGPLDFAGDPILRPLFQFLSFGDPNLPSDSLRGSLTTLRVVSTP